MKLAVNRIALLFAGLGLILLCINPAFGIGSTIAPGQVLKITVAGHPEFTQTVIVRQDGTTEYPLLAGIPLDGLTGVEVKNLLIPILLRYEREPEVFVIISEVSRVKAQVFGAVSNPVRIDTEGPLNLQQVIQMAGGVTADADINSVRIVRTMDNRRIEQVVNITDFFRSDSVLLAPEILDGDVVIVPRTNRSDLVRVLGEINSPGALVVIPGENLLDLIYRAGGFRREADQNRVDIISNSNGVYTRTSINITKLLRKGRVMDLPSIMPGDVIIVVTKDEWRRLGFWATFVHNIALLATSIIVIYRITT